MEYIERVGGTEIDISNSNGDIVNNIRLLGNVEQNGIPTPTDPQEIVVITGVNTITVSDGTNTNEYTLDLGDLELCKINNITDSIRLIDNNWCLTKQIGKLVLNGSENWQFYGDSRWKFRLNVNDILPFTNSTYDTPTTVICSHFTVTNWNNANNNGMFTGMRDINTTLSFAYNDMATLADFKSWLSNNNVTIYYVLNSPIMSEITNELLINELNSLMITHLPYGTVNIKWEGDLPATLGITYNNWNKYINPSDRQALLDGTATIETKMIFPEPLMFKKINTQLFYNDEYDEASGFVRAEYIPVEYETTYDITNINTDTVVTFAYGLKRLSIDLDDFVNNINELIVHDMLVNMSNHNDETILICNADCKYIFIIGTNNTHLIQDRLCDISTTIDTLTEDTGIISWNYEDFRYVKDQGWIGQFVARQLTGELKNISDDFNITDKNLELQLGVRTNDNTNWYSLGNFLVSKPTDDEVNDKTSFEALDYTKKFNKLYEDRMTYPCTAGELAQDVCDQCGVELGNNIFKNSDYIIEGNVFNNNETCRDVMKAIGKLAFSWVRVDWDNKVYFDFYKQNEVNEFNKANNSKYYNLKTQKEKFGPVNRIIIGYSQIEGERTKIEDGDSIDANGLCELTIYDNPLVYTQEQRESIIASASDLLGLEYMPLNTLTVGHPWLQGDNLFEITDMEGNTFNTIPFDRTIQYFGHIKTAIDVATATKTNTEYAYESNIARAAHNAEIQVNKVTGEITALTSRTTVVENAIKNTYTMEQTNELVQNAEHGVTNTFSESGGNNIFRNTGLWFTQSDENNPYEFWDGNVEQIKEEKASNTRAMLLKNNTLSQEQIVPNGNYTISFKYKKLINLANVKCVINDIEYPLTSTNDTEFVQTIEVSSQHINVKFITDIDDSCEIYDLMVNTGTVKLAYSQNQNETTTDTVNISKGITITSTDTDTTFKANADGIRTLDRNGNELTKFTDTGMTTKKMIVEDTSEIVGLLVQQVGNQTWFTKL